MSNQDFMSGESKSQPHIKPLSAHEESTTRQAALKAFMSEFQNLNPAPVADVESIMYSGDGKTQRLLLNVIRSMPMLLVIALFALLIVVADKSIGIFSQTAMTAQGDYRYIVGVAGWVFINFTLLITSFGGELEKIRTGYKTPRFTLLRCWHWLQEFIGFREPSTTQQHTMSGFARLLLLIDITASVSAVWLTLETQHSNGTPQEQAVTVVMAFAIGIISPVGVHKLGGMLADHGNRALTYEIEKVTMQYRQEYDAYFQRAWESYWDREGSRILHTAFVRRRQLDYHVDSPYLLLADGGEEGGFSKLPLVKREVSSEQP